MNENIKETVQLEMPLKLQNNHTKEEFWDFLSQMALSDADERARKELLNYLNEDFLRFCYTFSLLPDIDQKKKVLEIGGNPYYLTALMKYYSKYDVECTNYFNTNLVFSTASQTMLSADGKIVLEMPYINLNIEKHWYSENDGYDRDVLIFCEVFEHMVESPVRTLLNVNRMLKNDGCLVMSTPNVNRLENIAKMLSGVNIYDQYSGYGLYGRHNREYNRHELVQLLNLCGFEIEEIFTSQVHPDGAGNYYDIDEIIRLISKIPNRTLDLGQYIFIKAKKVKDVVEVNAPGWLYRSYSDTRVLVGENIRNIR